MSRISVNFAQWTFDAANKLTYRSAHASRPKRLLAGLGQKILTPFAKKFAAREVVSASLFGRTLLMPAEHPLPATLATFPQYNNPLLLAVDAIATQKGSEVSIIDVGANVGDTVAMIEQHRPGSCSFLCIEADTRLAELCRLNHADNPRVTVKRCFIGKEEGAAVWLQDDGRANPSTKLASREQNSDLSNYDRLIGLDTAAREFAEERGHLSLIKVDTEGYDFSVLRSGPNLLREYGPSILFEWYPQLLKGLNESVWGGFEYLGSFGYRHFVFFTNRGDFYCKISDPDRLFLRSLSSVVLRDPALGYFDVFASMQPAVCEQLVEASIEFMGGMQALGSSYARLRK
jgi:FkbM family methyltransferase